jgi:predicted SAM-dependent methyltransferase
MSNSAVTKEILEAATPPRSSAAPLLRLNVGCASTVAAKWTNIDNCPTIWLAQRPLLWQLADWLRLIPTDMKTAPTWAPRVTIADARRHLPFPSGTVDAIYSSHFLEHLSREEAICFLREARRTLKPGGLIRTVVPDLSHLVGRYQQARAAGDEHAADHLFDDLWVVDRTLHRYPAWFRPVKAFLRTNLHKCMYDERLLTALLRGQGFTDIRPCRYLESAIPGIEGVESEDRVLGAVCLEAQNPGPSP